MSPLDKDKVTGSYIFGYHDETPSERKLAKALESLKLNYAREVPIKGYTVDFLIDDWLVVEVDGESHVGKEKQDAIRQKEIEDAGFTVIRIKAMELSGRDQVKQAAKRIARLAKEGPSWCKQSGFANADWKNQIEKVKQELRHARSEGEETAKRRESIAYSNGRAAPEESMEDYFGKPGEDFAKLYAEWDKGHRKKRISKEENDPDGEDGLSRRRRK